MGSSMGSAMHMASSTMDMAMHMASSTMDMASSTMAAMSSAMPSAGMNGMDHGGMNHGGMDGGMDHGMMSMNLYLTKAYKDYPVLFQGLSAANGGQAFGIFLLLFFIGFFTKFLEFLRNYLEQKVWVAPSYAHFSDSDSNGKSSDTERVISTPNSSIPAMLIRNSIRLVLIFVPEMFGFALMLAAMTFCLIYFFAVVAGLTIGKFTFERISARYHIRQIPTLLHHG